MDSKTQNQILEGKGAVVSEPKNMTFRPILFSAPMVRAILDGRKTQTRRVVKPQPANCADLPMARDLTIASACPYGQCGDRLWVRETFAVMQGVGVKYRSDNPGARKPSEYWDTVWTPSIFMPRSWSRITLEIVSVQVDRLRGMSNEDAQAEGIQVSMDEHSVNKFADLWDSINGKTYPWKDNPWVWVIEFKKL